jgi:hypothetical protein
MSSKADDDDAGNSAPSSRKGSAKLSDEVFVSGKRDGGFPASSSS